MSAKNILKLLMGLNLVLLGMGLYLFQVNAPSDFVRFGRTFTLGTNALYLLLNLWLYQKQA